MTSTTVAQERDEREIDGGNLRGDDGWEKRELLDLCGYTMFGDKM